jgi:hypothetical protein
MSTAKRDPRTGKINNAQSGSEPAESGAELLTRMKINGAELDAKRFDPFALSDPAPGPGRSGNAGRTT